MNPPSVPSVFIGLTLIALFFVNPATWFVAGAVWFAVGFRHYRHRLTIRDTPTSKIGAAAIGLVEVSGRVCSDTVEAAPLSGTPCLYWRTKIERYEEDKSTAVIADRQAAVRCFEIEDATGKVLIWPWASERIFTGVRRWDGAAALGLAHTAPAGPIRDVLNGTGVRGSRLVVTEETIEVGKTLYVIGELSERGQVAKPTPFAERLRRKLQPNLGTGHETGLDALKVFALAIGGVVLGLASGQFVVLSEDSQTEQPPEIDPRQVLIWRGDQGRPFIIADTPEGVVIDTLTKWTKVALIGGAGTMLGTVILYLGGLFS